MKRLLKWVWDKTGAEPVRFYHGRDILAILSVMCGAPDPWMLSQRDRKKGKKCFLLGSGPSLTSVDLSLLKGQDVMALNGAVFVENVDITYFITVSKFFYKAHVEKLEALKCRSFLPTWLKDKLSPVNEASWLNCLLRVILGARPRRFRGIIRTIHPSWL